MKCFIDMDGILTDFHGAMLNHFGVKDIVFTPGSWDTVDVLCKQVNITHKQFWGHLNVDFWSNMPWMKDGKDILQILFDEFGEENCCLLSSPANAMSAHGKILWIQENLPKFWKDGRFCLNRNKNFLAHSKSILIDDYDKNVDEFLLNNGNAILYPRLWNSAHINIRDNNLEELKKKLCTMCINVV